MRALEEARLFEDDGGGGGGVKSERQRLVVSKYLKAIEPRQNT